METNFKSLIQLLDYFKDEDTCKSYLALQRWNGQPCCPHCGSTKTPYVTNRGYKCSDKDCYKKFTVITGTIYENTKISLRMWFAALYLISAHKKGISSLQLARDLNITQKTSWFMLHRIREMLKNRSMEKMTGTVEADETYVGGKLSNKHARKQQKETLGRGVTSHSPVVAVVQRNGGVKAIVTDNVGSGSIYKLITENVEKGSRLITDGFTSYKWVGMQYDHVAIKHTSYNGKKNFITHGENHTNTVEGFFSHLKRMIIGTYHHVSRKHLQAYCDELSYRYSTRMIKDTVRFKVCFQGMNTRLKYADLISK